MLCKLFIFLEEPIGVGDAYFGEGNSPIVMDDVRCSGLEQGLLYCKRETTHNCKSSEAAGVICQGTFLTRVYYCIIIIHTA